MAFVDTLARAGLWPSQSALERRHPPRGVFVQAQGARLHLIQRRAPGVRGDIAVILLHGASGNAQDMSLTLFDELARAFHVIAVDRPGHGWSTRPGDAADADPARQARIIHSGLARLGIPRVLLVAHSWSGGLALHMALNHPDFVAGLVLVGAASHPWPGGAIGWYNRLASQDGLAGLLSHAAPIGRLVMKPGIRAAFHPQKPIPGFANRTALPLLFRPSQFRANAQDMAGLHGFLTAQAPRYGELRTPVTTIVSDADRIVPMEHGLALAGQSDRVRLQVLHGFGHMMQHVAAPAVARAVKDLAVRLDAAPARARAHEPA